MAKRSIKNSLRKLGLTALAFVVTTASIFPGIANARTLVNPEFVLETGQIVEYVKNDSIFKDVDENHWGIEAIKWGVDEGLVKGYVDGTFRPELQVTEAEFATLLARYVRNTDKEKIKQYGKDHWADFIYDELEKWKLPFDGYNDNKVRDTGITRGKIAQIVAAKYGFNLTERQAVYFMYENDLSYGMIPNQMTFESYKVDETLNRVMAVEFLRKLNDKGYVEFMGKPSPITDSRDIAGIEDVPPETVEITDEMFDELARKKGIKNPKREDKTMWEKLAESGGITKDEHMTPEVVQKIRDLGPLSIDWYDKTSDGGWVEIDDKTFQNYYKVIKEYMKENPRVNASTVVTHKDLYWETEGPGKSKGTLLFGVIVDGREYWIVHVIFNGREYKAMECSRAKKDIFEN